MRILVFIFLIFTISAAAQKTALKTSFETGIETARRGEFEKAAETFQRVLLSVEVEKSPDEFLAKIHFNLGVCLYRSQKIEKSVGEFNEAIKLSRREYKQAFYALGMAQSDLKKYDKAENAFLDALKLEKSDGEIWFDLGFVYLQKQEFEKAENAFQKAIKFKSISAFEAYNNLGVIAALRHEFDAAEKYFETAWTMSGNKFATARNNLQFCKFYRQKNQAKDLIAKLEFSK